MIEETAPAEIPAEVEKTRDELIGEVEGLLEDATFPEDLTDKPADLTDSGADPQAKSGGIEETQDEITADQDPEIDNTAPDAVDYEQLIPQSDGREAVSLGEMKDRLTEFERTEQRMQDRENETAAKQAEFESVMQQVGEIPPELRQFAEDKRVDNLKRNYSKMVEVLPEMATPEGFERVKKQAAAGFKRYGVSDREIGTISDWRQIKMAVDNERMHERAENAKSHAAQVNKGRRPQGRKPTRRTNASALNDQVNAAANSGSRQDKISAIDNLIS